VLLLACVGILLHSAAPARASSNSDPVPIDPGVVAIGVCDTVCITQLYMSDPTTVSLVWTQKAGVQAYIVTWWKEGQPQQQAPLGADVRAVAFHNVDLYTHYFFRVTQCSSLVPLSCPATSAPADIMTTGAGTGTDPAAVSWGAGRIDVVVRGPNNDMLHT